MIYTDSHGLGGDYKGIFCDFDGYPGTLCGMEQFDVGGQNGQIVEFLFGKGDTPNPDSGPSSDVMLHGRSFGRGYYLYLDSTTNSNIASRYTFTVLENLKKDRACECVYVCEGVCACVCATHTRKYLFIYQVGIKKKLNRLMEAFREYELIR